MFSQPTIGYLIVGKHLEVPHERFFLSLSALDQGEGGGDHRSSQALLALVEDGGLARGDGPLGLGKGDFDAIAFDVLHDGGLEGLAVSQADQAGKGRIAGWLAGDPVHPLGQEAPAE